MEIKQTVKFKKWLKGLKDKSAKAKIAAQITRLASGNFGKCEPVGNGVSEIKIDFGPRIPNLFWKKK